MVRLGKKGKTNETKQEYGLQPASSSCAEVKLLLGQQPSLGGDVLEEGAEVGIDWMRQLLQFAWNPNIVFKTHVLPWKLRLSSVSAKQTRLSLKSSLKSMPEWPAGCSDCQPHTNVFWWVQTLHHLLRSPLLSLLKPNPKSVARRERALPLALLLDAVPAAGDVSSKQHSQTGKTQHVLFVCFCSLTCPVCCSFVFWVFFFSFFMTVFPRIEEAPDGKCAESLLLSCPLLSSSSSAVPSQSQPVADPCQGKFPHQGLAQ